MKSIEPKRPAQFRFKSGALLLAVLASTVIPASAITLGEPDGNRHPNVGAIVVDVPPGLFGDAPDGGLFQICSGTLIHSRVFLTAGHCTDFVNLFASLAGIERVFVSFNKDNALDPASLLPITDFVTHPGYIPSNGGGSIPSRDVGVLVLRNPVPGLTPATLAPPGFLDRLKKEGRLRTGSNGARFTVVGYGAQLDWPPPQFIFPDGLRRVAESEFLALDKSWLILSQNQALGNSGTGNGDSGGPTFWNETDGREMLVSITSRGDIKLVATGVTYRIDTQDSFNFINGVIASLP